MGDTAQLREVCGHIWQNAIDAMPHGGELVWQTSASPDLESPYSNKGDEVFSRYVRLQVSDSGEGMGEETLTNIFAPFFSTRSGKGRGLGATAVYQIVKAHGGYVEVSSGIGAGSCINL